MEALLARLTERWPLAPIGDWLQDRWVQLLDVIGDDPTKLWVFGTTALVFCVYWLYAAIFTFMDITQRPKFLRKYKIQPGRNEPLDLRLLWKAIKMVVFNLSVVNAACSWVIFKFLNPQSIESIRQLPTFGRALRDFVAFVVLEEIMFYYAHRLLHHKAIYKHVHKKHHEWTSPCAAMSLYAHPVEHIVANLMPPGLALGFLRSHIAVAWLAFSLAIMNSINDHAGYHFPWSAGSVRFHDYHHEKFNYNYGVLGWLDKLHGTYHETKKDISLNSKKKKAALKQKTAGKRKIK